jgi:2-polyprenyl-6-hydroxyphenyl methylase/3-demethylubiquinone-9 3-methyltransferase
MSSAMEGYYETYWSEAGFYPHGQLTPELREIFQTYLPAGASCLDLGCGDGKTSGAWLRANGFKYLGVDLSANAIRDARSFGLAAIEIADASVLPLLDGSFDAVLCIEVLEHLFRPDLAAAEILRVLKPRGLLLVSVPNVAYWRRRMDLLMFGRWNPLGDDLSVKQPWRDPHIRFFNPGSLRRMLTRVGFESISVGGYDGRLLRDVPWVGPRVFAGGSASNVYRAAESKLPSPLGFRLYAVAYKPGEPVNGLVTA